MSTVVIAEAGVNHNGEIQLALQLVDAAADAGADIVKFQTFSAGRLATAGAATAAYQRPSAGESQREMLRRLELTEQMHRKIMARCERRGIRFLSTGFDIESVDLLVRLGVDRLKVPSGEITNLPYLRHVARFGLPVILSTGMSTLDEIGRAIDELVSSGLPHGHLTVLQCTTEYPTPLEHANLKAMLAIRDAFNVAVGFSDHTTGTVAAVAAAALGAEVIEKHFTLSRALPGPDHRASLEPDELKHMVAAIRDVETALGDGIKRVTPAEADNQSAARKSLVAAREIRRGEPFSAENLTVKRPGTGISPMRWDEVIGRRAGRDFRPDELIEL